MEGTFHDRLRKKADQYAFEVYQVTREFPRDELYGITSQLRRAALSVILNYIEGYARKQPKVQKNFFDIAYGSLKETMYLLSFSYRQKYLKEATYIILKVMGQEISQMLWGMLKRME